MGQTGAGQDGQGPGLMRLRKSNETAAAAGGTKDKAETDCYAMLCYAMLLQTLLLLRRAARWHPELTSSSSLATAML